MDFEHDAWEAIYHFDPLWPCSKRGVFQVRVLGTHPKMAEGSFKGQVGIVKQQRINQCLADAESQAVQVTQPQLAITDSAMVRQTTFATQRVTEYSQEVEQLGRRHVWILAAIGLCRH